ncbi:zinc finger, CCHC-type containing protein, partial [Tanacetum coccineum]
MKNNETVSDFAGKLGSIRGKFKSLGSTLKDKTLVRKLLNSVPKKFLPIVASIEQYSEIDEMSFEEAMGRIITFEERIKSQDEPEENYQNKLLMARSSNQNHGNGRGRNFSKEEKGRGTSFQQSTREQNKNKMRCYECGDLGTNKEIDEISSVAYEMVRLIETASVPIFGVDASGLINGWNGKIAELTGVIASEAMGKSLIDEVIHETSRVVVEDLVYRALQ